MALTFSVALAKVLWKNMNTLIKVYMQQGGVSQLAKHTMQPANTAAFMNNVGSHICAVLNVDTAWSVPQLERAFAEYLDINGWDPALVKLVVEEVLPQRPRRLWFFRMQTNMLDPDTHT